MKIWCTTHDSEKQPDMKATCWAKQDWVQLEGECSLVPMQLVPPDTLVIVKEDGEWQLSPQAWHVLNAASAFGVPTGSMGLLDALAAAQGRQT